MFSHLQQISQLVQEVSAKEQKLLPKKKFAFKSRKKGSQPQTKGAEGREGGEGEGGKERGVGSNLQLKNSVGFRDRKDEKLLMSVSCKKRDNASFLLRRLVHLF